MSSSPGVQTLEMTIIEGLIKTHFNNRDRLISLRNFVNSELDKYKTPHKVVINACWGGFWLSDESRFLYNEIRKPSVVDREFCQRNDPVLILLVEKLGARAGGANSRLEVRSIELGASQHWEIDEYDGMETIVVREGVVKQEPLPLPENASSIIDEYLARGSQKVILVGEEGQDM